MKIKLILGTSISLIVFLIAFFVFINFNIDNLRGTSWEVENWSKTSVSFKNAPITLKFNKNGTVSGSGGVNTYSCFYNISFDDKIVFSDVQSTEMASTNSKLNKAETLYFSLLVEIKYYKVVNEKLQLMDNHKNVIITLKKN